MCPCAAERGPALVTGAEPGTQERSLREAGLVKKYHFIEK